MENAIIDMFETICGKGFFTRIANALRGSVVQSLIHGGVDENGQAIEALGANFYNNVFLPIGLGLLVIYLLIDIMSKVSSDHFNNKMLIQSLLKFIIIYAVMRNALKIYDLSLSLADSVVRRIGSDGDGTIFTSDYLNNNGAKQAATALATRISNGHSGTFKDIMIFLEKLMKVLTLALPYGLAWVSLLICIVISATRNIELTAYIMASPIALANFVGSSLEHSGSFRYLKKILALSFQAIAIAVIALAINQLSINEFIRQANASGVNVSAPFNATDIVDLIMGANFMTLVWGIIYRVAGAFLIMKSSQFANDLIG